MRVSNSLDPDQVRHLGLNCLQSLTAYNKSYRLLVRVNQNPGQRRSLINYLVSLINNVKNGNCALVSLHNCFFTVLMDLYAQSVHDML